MLDKYPPFHPPAIKTYPSYALPLIKAAECPPLDVVMFPANENDPEPLLPDGSKISQEAVVLPPITKTLPLLRRTDSWLYLAVVMLPVLENVLVDGSYNSADDKEDSELSYPPQIRTFPFFSSVAV